MDFRPAYIVRSRKGIATKSLYNHNREIVPVQLRRLGLTAKLWRETFDKVLDLDQAYIDTFQSRWNARNSQTTLCCEGCCDQHLPTQADVEKEIAEALRPGWVELIQSLQPTYSAFAVDLGEIPRNHWGIWCRGLRFYLPGPTMAGGSGPETGPQLSPETIPAVQAKVITDRGEIVSTVDTVGDDARSSLVQDLEKLISFHKEGQLDDDEFAMFKRKLLLQEDAEAAVSS